MASVAEKMRFAGVFAWLQPYRLWIQTAFLAVWLLPIGTRLHGICAPVFHCYGCPLATFGCPIGMLAHAGALHLIPFMTIGLLILFGAFVGSLFCGWACPFGWLQDLAAKIPTPKFELPRWTGHFRFVVLGATVLAIPYLFRDVEHPFFICMVCPAGGLEAGLPSVVNQAAVGQQIDWPNTLKLTITGVFLVAILFFRRPWCRVLCPLGVIFSAFNRVSAFFLRFDRAKCTECGRCGSLCQYNIEPEKSPNDLRCIRCLECTRCNLGALAPQTILHRRRKPPAERVPPVSEPPLGG
ncbi:MAG: 4Fe-4S binding protein [Phycisphaerales bacterium]